MIIPTCAKCWAHLLPYRHGGDRLVPAPPEKCRCKRCNLHKVEVGA